MGTHFLGTTTFSDEEIQYFRRQLQEIGPQWSQLAEQMGKSAAVLKTFYFHYKKKHGFDSAVNEYYKLHANEDRRPALTDGDESDVSVTSSDGDDVKMEGEKMQVDSGSPQQQQLVAKPVSIPTTSVGTPMGNSSISITAYPPTPVPAKPNTNNLNNNNIPANYPNSDGQKSSKDTEKFMGPQQINVPPQFTASAIPVSINNFPPSLVRNKKISEDYDSSATETADEENECSPANRQSPKVPAPGYLSLKLPPSSGIQGNQLSNGPSNVRDVIVNVIERSVKSGMSNTLPLSKAMTLGGPGPLPLMKPNQPNPQSQGSQNDVMFVREYPRNDPHKGQLRPPNDSLATLSLVNPNLPANQQQPPQLITQHPIGITSQIAATITPVPPLNSQQSRPSSNPSLVVGQRPQNQVQNQEPEQAFDLSIKKPAQAQQQDRTVFQIPAKSIPAPPPPSNSGATIYRGDPSITINPSGQPNFLPYDINRHSNKSPQTYNMGQVQGQQIGGRIIQQQTPSSPSSAKKAKVSPFGQKIIQSNQPGVQQVNGPKGSITHGTPMNPGVQPIIIGGSTTLSPAYREIYRQQTPPSSDNKVGSITQGTPVVLPGHHLADKRNYENFYKNSRQSPAQQGNPGNQPPTSSSSPQSTPQQFGAPFAPRGYMDQPQQLAQQLANDYIISQQMHGQQSRGVVGSNSINLVSIANNRQEKESPSSRGITLSSSPASIYYASDKDRQNVQQSRAEYMSRTSPADHNNR
jgi:hypothetical protein